MKVLAARLMDLEKRKLASAREEIEAAIVEREARLCAGACKGLEQLRHAVPKRVPFHQ